MPLVEELARVLDVLSAAALGDEEGAGTGGGATAIFAACKLRVGCTEPISTRGGATEAFPNDGAVRWWTSEGETGGGTTASPPPNPDTRLDE